MRLTTNKSVDDMSMVELAHNSCYVDDEGNARYRDYEMEMDARDFARNLMITLTKNELPVDDAEFDEEILDNLKIDPFSDIRGLIALFYRNLWTMADLREKLAAYEDDEEQGLLLKLPCKVGDTVWDNDYGRPCAYTITAFSFGECEEYICEPVTTKETVFYYANSSGSITGSFAESEIGKSVFLNKSKAEAKLKEMEEKHGR